MIKPNDSVTELARIFKDVFAGKLPRDSNLTLKFGNLIGEGLAVAEQIFVVADVFKWI
jgi:hypothetical protein